MALQNADNTVRPGALMVVATALMAVGLVMVATSSVSVDRSLLDGPLLQSPFGRQVVFLLLGLTVMLVSAQVSTVVLRSETWRRRIVLACCGVTLVCLLAALLPGLADSHRGSNRWLRFAVGGFGFGFQPSELAKPVLVIFLAWLLSDRIGGTDGGASRQSMGSKPSDSEAGGCPRARARGSDALRRFSPIQTIAQADPRDLKTGFLPAAVALGAFVALVGKEDFGTSVLLCCVGTSMLVVAGCRFRHLASIAGAGAVGMAGLLYAAPYRLARITAFQDIWADPQGGGYQPLQSLATIASGGWFGTGLGAGIQKYGYLPESHTDFIFAVICEETGVFGAGLVLGLYGVFVWLGLRVMLSAATRFEGLLAFGLTATLGLQAAMNVAVVTVVTPTTGISLPLVSAGGSGLIAFCLLTGVLMAVAIRGADPGSARFSGVAVFRAAPTMV